MNTSTCCARAVSRVQHTARYVNLLAPARHLHQAARHETSLRPSPLLLDFLAPSWTTYRPRTGSVQSVRLGASRKSTVEGRRSLSSSLQRPAIAVANARKDDEGKEMLINITPRAAHRLQAIAEKDKNPELALRVSVESGGCHGFQYLMKLINLPDTDKAEDTIFENEADDKQRDGFKARVVLDEPSLELLKGSSIDYTMELIGSQFKVTGIPGAKSSCGCGTSFDIAE